MNATVQALADLLVEKAPNQIRLAFNEEDATRDATPEAAHFLKFTLDGDERRMGRDLELYSFINRLSGDDDRVLLPVLLEELVLPIKSYAPEAYTAAIALLRERGVIYEPILDRQEEWNALLDSLSK